MGPLAFPESYINAVIDSIPKTEPAYAYVVNNIRRFSQMPIDHPYRLLYNSLPPGVPLKPANYMPPGLRDDCYMLHSSMSVPAQDNDTESLKQLTLRYTKDLFHWLGPRNENEAYAVMNWYAKLRDSVSASKESLSAASLYSPGDTCSADMPRTGCCDAHSAHLSATEALGQSHKLYTKREFDLYESSTAQFPTGSWYPNILWSMHDDSDVASDDWGGYAGPPGHTLESSFATLHRTLEYCQIKTADSAMLGSHAAIIRGELERVYLDEASNPRESLSYYLPQA